MKKKRIINVLIVVILVALLSVCIGLIFGTSTYPIDSISEVTL